MSGNTFDQIDLAAASIQRSAPDIADWPATVHITHVHETPQGGYEFSFDRELPESWKWHEAGSAPGENLQFTVWAFVRHAGQWFGAAFVQMWQGRSMRDGSLPAIFADASGRVVGFENWWGDVRHLWGDMSEYVPLIGDQIGFLVAAGNGRLRTDVTSVRERSQLVLVPVRADGVLDLDVAFDPTSGPVPGPVTPTDPPLPPLNDDEVAKFLALLEQGLVAVRDLKSSILDLRTEIVNVTKAGLKVHF